MYLQHIPLLHPIDLRASIKMRHKVVHKVELRRKEEKKR